MIDPPGSTAKPDTIRVATYLLWVAVALEPVLVLVDSGAGKHEDVGRAMALAIGLAFTCIAGLATFFFSKGRDWARVALLILFVMGLVSLAVTIQALFSESGLVASLSVVQLSVQGLGLYLAYSLPGSSYFRGGISNDAAMRAILPVGRSAWAIAAGYLALFSVLLVPAPFALICGILAVRDIRRDPAKHGMGRAIFGLVMGSLGVLTILFLVGLRMSR